MKHLKSLVMACSFHLIQYFQMVLTISELEIQFNISLSIQFKLSVMYRHVVYF